MQKYSPESVETYTKQVLVCLNVLLAKVKVPTRLGSIQEVTPEIVGAFAEYCFDRKVGNLVSFLEQRLQIPLRHLDQKAYERGDLFNCLSLTEIVYNLLRQRMELPAFPVFTEEVVRYFRRRVDAMRAQAVWLAAHGQENPSGALQAASLQDKYVCGQVKREGVAESSKGPRPVNVEINVEALYQKHLKPLVNKYYVPYQRPEEVEYTEHRLRTKLEKAVQNAIQAREINTEKFNDQLRQLVHQNLVRATAIERRNLVDEAHWRRDERNRLLHQNKGLGEAVMNRKRMEAELQKEREEELRRQAEELRREELIYVKKTRKTDEEDVFNRIAQEITTLHNKKPDPAVFQDQIQRQVDKRLRIYAGPERDVLEGDGRGTYRQRITGQWKNVQDDVEEPEIAFLKQ